ncbi:WAS/WASL-interacting protein family member 3-like [Palaemon carinicauda]|uniref:WAS/WASL-interacting protein family member 3-like n=1 Tax=Palaemon carinicauda TaxID=392227 RepID=UPI0035B6899C
MPPPPPPPPPPPHSAASPAAVTVGRSIALPIPDSSSCHHCHIHAPIPAKDLKRTHPLRSSLNVGPKIEVATVHKKSNDGPLNFRKNVSFLYRKIHKNDAKIAAKHRHQAEAAAATLSTQIPRPPASDIQPAVIIDSLPPLPPVPPRTYERRHRPVGLAGLQAAVLIGAYALLLVLAIVIGVVLSQSQDGNRRTRGRRPVSDSPLPQRPAFRGAALSPLEGAGPIRISRPRNPQGRPRPSVGVPLPAPPPPPRPTTTPPPPPPPTDNFVDYDYVYVDDAPVELLPNPVTAAPRPVFNPEPLPAPRQPVFTQQPRRPSQAQAPRRPVGTLASIDRDFNLDDEEQIRGRKEPEVKILRSWSHQNGDGTFSWGYVNTDGSFKNETKGLDCVVRGVYGYVDKDTGREVSFPYESGNPCDPDAPDYYYDYDTNTMRVRDGATGEVFAKPGSGGSSGGRRQG